MNNNVIGHGNGRRVGGGPTTRYLPPSMVVKNPVDESQVDRVAYREHVVRIVNTIKSLGGDVVGDVITETFARNDYHNVFEIRCRMCVETSIALPKLLAFDYHVQMHSEKRGSRFIYYHPSLINQSSSEYVESVYHIWVPLSSANGVHRKITLNIVICKLESFNWFNNLFDIDTLCQNSDRIFLSGTGDSGGWYSDKDMLSITLDRAKRRVFCLLRPSLGELTSQGGELPPTRAHEMDVMTESTTDTPIKTELVNNLLRTIERAYTLVKNKGWVMDDMIRGRKSWIVAKWSMLKKKPDLVRTKIFRTVDGITEGAAKHMLSKSLYAHVCNQPDAPTRSDTCAICQEGFLSDDIIVNLSCNHNFHWVCNSSPPTTVGESTSCGGRVGVDGLCTWISSNRSCPYCRENIE